MDSDKNISFDESDEETPFSEISETDSQYLTRRTLQKRHRNSAPGSAGNSPNKKKNKSAKTKQALKVNKQSKTSNNSAMKPDTKPSTNTSSNNSVTANNKINEITEPRTFTEPVPPPIYVSKIDNFIQFGQEIANLIGPTNFRCFSRVNDIKINTNTKDDYKKLINHLTALNHDFHCYQLKEDKTYRVVLRGLHSTTPTTAIKKDLEDIGHSVRHISSILHPIDKYPLPLFFIDLEPARNNAEIFEVKRLLYSVVKFEEPRQKPIVVQCTKCQNLGHTKAYCHHSVRCVKCAGPHASNTCQKPLNEPPKCALCGEDHPATYRGCIIYKKLYKQ